ncbi:MAG: hypothetical protein QXW97_02460 [Candidatus Pacearchaeota archaeon]
MESRIGNITGNFDEYDITCPRCGNKRVVISADENGYFSVVECLNCGYNKEYDK